MSPCLTSNMIFFLKESKQGLDLGLRVEKPSWGNDMEPNLPPRVWDGEALAPSGCTSGQVFAAQGRCWMKTRVAAAWRNRHTRKRLETCMRTHVGVRGTASLDVEIHQDFLKGLCWGQLWKCHSPVGERTVWESESLVNRLACDSSCEQFWRYQKSDFRSEVESLWFSTS